MVQSLTGAAKAGIYSVGYNASNLVLLAAQALARAFLPGYYTLMNEARYDEVDRQCLLIVKLLAFAAAAVVVFADVLLFVLAAEGFREARVVIAPVVMGNTFYAVAQIYNWAISYTKRTGLLSISALTAGALNIILNWLLIPRFGFVVAAYTTAVSYLVFAALSFTLAFQLCRCHLTSPRLLWRPMVLLLLAVLLETIVVERLPVGWPIPMALRTMLIVGLFYALLLRDDGTGVSIRSLS
jgi:O-antigen/teichoic acid export membrane protein